jgi:pyruvate dehydrogenase E2 component (dihydrolipoamide acetyltransferase)
LGGKKRSDEVQQQTVKIPQMGLTTEEVALVEWLVSVGDRVLEGDVIANLEADKALVELEATVSGEISELLVDADDSALLEVGVPVAVINQD